jgi:hypothetical protein
MKRTPLKRKTPLRQKRPLPRAAIKRKSGAAGKTAAEKRHLDRVAAMPCLICSKPGPSTIHHVRHTIIRSGTFARDHKRVVPLCSAHHLHDHSKESVERLHEAGIYAQTGIDLWKEAERLWRESDAQLA